MMPSPVELLLPILLIFLFVGLFFLFRSVILWYYRINEIVDLLTQIRDRLPPPR